MQPKKFLWVLLGVFFCIPQVSSAAYLYFDPGEVTVYRGDTVTVSLRLDTDEGECVNTVDAVLTYGEGVRAVDISTGDSIVNLWVEPPTIQESERTITFAGGMIGGYCGRAVGDPSLTNVVAEIVFQSPGFSVGGSGGGESLVRVTDQSSVLLNDGFGTPATLRMSDARLILDPEPAQNRTDAWSARVREDREPPADFTITLGKDEFAFSGQHFITWNSQDKQSGIDHYEVMEEPLEDFYAFRWGRADAPWVTTESPYVLKDQTLNSTIRVRAIDKAGNETIAVLVPDPAMRSLSRDRLLMYAVGVGVAGILVSLLIFVLYRRRQALMVDRDTDSTS